MAIGCLVAGVLLRKCGSGDGKRHNGFLAELREKQNRASIGITLKEN
jgi:hypothetical protein